MTGTVTAEAATSRPLRKDAARNRELLIAAAREVFAERGLDASLDDVARHAGLGVGTAYRHFANKHELARAIFKEGVDEMVQLAEGCSSSDCRAWDSLVRFLEGAADKQTADRGLREVLMGAYDAEQMERVHDRLTSPLKSLVERAHEQGDLREGVDVTDVGVVLMMVCTVADITGEVSPDLWRRYLPMLLDGLRAGAQSPLPVGPISEDMLRAAMSSHKQRLVNGGPSSRC